MTWDASRGELVVKSPLSDMNTVPLEAEYFTARNLGNLRTTDSFQRFGPASSGNFVRHGSQDIGAGELSLMRGFHVHAGADYEKLMVKRYRKIGNNIYEEITFTLLYDKVLARLECQLSTPAQA